MLVAATAICTVITRQPAPRDVHPAAFGLLAPTTTQLRLLSPASGIADIEVSAAWGYLEPSEGEFNHSRLSALRLDVRNLTTRGFGVVLDLGLQYPPAWVFGVGGQTRFVDQYGDAWNGGVSVDVPNAVFNPRVRAAEGSYIQRLGQALHGLPVSRVRVGGLLSGELRYPPATYDGHTDALWDYDDAAQEQAPVPGWRPGSGSLKDAYRSLKFYFTALNGYLRWQLTMLAKSLPHSIEEVLFPSFGLRPGMVSSSVHSGLTGQSLAERTGLISSGLDWRQQVRTIAGTHRPAVLSSTWLDGPQEGSGVAGISPIAYLSRLGKHYGLPVSGENTGGGGLASLLTCLKRVSEYHLRDMMYMGGRLLSSDEAGITMGRLEAELRAFRIAR